MKISESSVYSIGLWKKDKLNMKNTVILCVSVAQNFHFYLHFCIFCITLENNQKYVKVF